MIAFMCRGLGLGVLLICLLAGCVREPAGVPGTPSPVASATEVGLAATGLGATPVATSTFGTVTQALGTTGAGTPAPAGTRLPRATATPIVMTPKSARVVVLKAYAFELATRCGIDFLVDFDASFWDAADVRPPGIGNPVQNGTMTLLDSRHARFNFSKSSISYTRHSGVKTIPYVCK